MSDIDSRQRYRMDVSCEQRAREMLCRMEVPGAMDMSAGEVVELANLIAASSLVRELAESPPWHAQGYMDDEYCFHCGAEKDREPHADTCLWLRAKRMAE